MCWHSAVVIMTRIRPLSAAQRGFNDSERGMLGNIVLAVKKKSVFISHIRAARPADVVVNASGRTSGRGKRGYGETSEQTVRSVTRMKRPGGRTRLSEAPTFTADSIRRHLNVFGSELCGRAEYFIS